MGKHIITFAKQIHSSKLITEKGNAERCREERKCRVQNAELRCGEGLATFIFLGCFVLGFSVQREGSSCGLYIVREQARRCNGGGVAVMIALSIAKGK